MIPMHVGNVLIGTCGYSYDAWKGTFYPEDLPSHEMLRYYSLIFSFVELDFTWYRMPTPHQLEHLAALTPSDFRMSLKVHRSLTHEVEEGWRAHAASFREAVTALQNTGRLGCVLVQLPYRFAYTVDNRRYLAHLLDELAMFPLVVEFRNAEWYLDRVFESLRARHVGLVTIDRPDLPGLPPESVVRTSDLGYYRLHGRNASLWWSGDSTSRYEYRYSDEELRERLRLVRLMAQQSTQLFVAFNNHAQGNAAANALTLQSMLASFKGG